MNGHADEASHRLLVLVGDRRFDDVGLAGGVPGDVGREAEGEAALRICPAEALAAEELLRFEGRTTVEFEVRMVVAEAVAGVAVCREDVVLSGHLPVDVGIGQRGAEEEISRSGGVDRLAVRIGFFVRRHVHLELGFAELGDAE